ncbi:MAG TPA: dicarboxylate--CoA ligase PimA, partial [Sphingomonas bacterium]|nr:dicarboxylate--CoA ligase PimA [Sphingomonas bacterium]
MTETGEVWRQQYRHPGEWDRPFPPETMIALFEASVAANGPRPLIDFLGRKFSYAETLDGANRVACGLAALGYGPGDRIGLFLPNVPHYLAAYYGILKLGATAVNFSPLYTVDELAHQVADSGTRLLFTLSATALLPTALKVLEKSALERLVVGSVAGALPATKSVLYRWFKAKEIAEKPTDSRIIAFSRLIANKGACSTPPLDPERDLALIQYTGGTTGVPKGAMLSHQNLSANARQVALLDP